MINNITLTNLVNVLATREKIQNAHAQNIANADTPGFKAKNTEFKEKLETDISGPLIQTNKSHIKKANHTPKFDISLTTEERMDANTVNIQKEMVGLAENQLLHELAAKALKKHLAQIELAIKEGGRT